ncbi:MAG: HD domain-containing protein, partial [Gammaproteobacteria bacterium]|nr:HD domain-containing protein [Gammaproteobacteria bacterium]
GLSADHIHQVLFAGLLHNIGKVGMADKLLKRAYEDMSEEEYALFVKHPVIGEGMLMAFDDLKEAASIIRSQHECYDGKGFPDKLHGEEIPIGSRILAIASDYEMFQLGTITSQKQNESEALDFLTNNRKTRYDPKLVVMFHEVIKSENLKKRGKNDKIRRVVASRLVPGMILADDVLIKDKVLVLSMGHVIDQHTIDRLKQLERSVDGAVVINIFDDY